VANDVLGHRFVWPQAQDGTYRTSKWIGEKKDIEFRASFQNAFNSANFLLRRRRQRCEHAECRGDGHAAIWTNPQPYRDFTVSSTNDPGGRVIEFTLRFNF
jgi:hypothetical protein